MLEIKNLSINYGEVQAVAKFNLNINKGEIISIVGESGSGKTTVIRALMGMLQENARVTSGTATYLDMELIGLNKKQWQELRGVKISMIFQDSGDMLNPIRKVGSQFIEFLRTHQAMTKAEALSKAENMLSRMGLSNTNVVLNSYPFQLSGGMRQRVGIAMAMAFEPKILLADEPTSALDVTTQAQIVKEMMELRDKFETSILMVTHNLGVASYMADKIVVMQRGLVVESGSSIEVMVNPKHEYTKKLLHAVPELEG